MANAVARRESRSDILLHPGEWRVAGTMEEFNIPGMPPEAQSAMKQAMSQHGNMTYDYCLTPEQAKRPQGKFFNDKAANNCRYDHFTMGGGKIDAVMRCDGKPSSMTMTIEGTYGADNYSTHVQMNMEGGPQGAMSMKMRSEAQARRRMHPRGQGRGGAPVGNERLRSSVTAEDHGCFRSSSTAAAVRSPPTRSSPKRSSRRSSPRGSISRSRFFQAAIAPSARGRLPSEVTTY